MGMACAAASAQTMSPVVSASGVLDARRFARVDVPRLFPDDDATDLALKQGAEENDAALAQIRAAGKVQVLALTDAQRAEWNKTMWPVHQERASRVGAQLLAETHEAAESNPP